MSPTLSPAWEKTGPQATSPGSPLPSLWVASPCRALGSVVLEFSSSCAVPLPAARPAGVTAGWGSRTDAQAKLNLGLAPKGPRVPNMLLVAPLLPAPALHS